MAEPITIEHLSKVYPGGNEALRDVSLSVEAGTFLVLLGPSGSGKTTLLRSVAGIERITSGRILLGDTAVADGRAHVPPDRRDLSMVFQDYALWPHLTVRDNVAFALRRRKLSRSECRERAIAMLDRVGLGPLAARYPNELSGGEQQRVALARALVADTGLILCDEPLSNLDADLRERMRVEISSLVREAGATTMYITHDQAEAFALADRVGVLNGATWSRSGPRRRSTPSRPARSSPGSPACPGSSRCGSAAGATAAQWRSRRRAWPGAGRSTRGARGARAGGTGLLMVRPTGIKLVGDPRRRAPPGRHRRRRRVPRPGLRARHRPAGLRPPDRRVRQRPVGPGRAGRPAARAGRLPRLPASRPGPGAAPAGRGDGGRAARTAG